MHSIVKLTVPEGISFISEWASMANGFQIPQGHCIINKILPGCGFTQYCITNNLPTILCSPRVVLLENKLAQNPGCFYVKPKTDSEKNKIKRKYDFETETEVQKFLFSQFKNELLNYLENNCIKPGIAPKILVTYDSLGKLVLALKDILTYLQSFYNNITLDLSIFSVVVDEFHLIFNDSAFKAEVELNFLSSLDKFPNVCYVSATPILFEYLEQMDEFKDLVYYELGWGQRAIQPKITMIHSNNIDQVARNIIERYKSGNFEKKLVEEKDSLGNVTGNKFIESREVVFYVNSVSTITNIIKTCNLHPSEVNIICSVASDKNRQKIKSCGKEFDFGTPPLYGQHHKMFTFCTSTAYCGVDFYSTCARTIVLSDGDSKCMAVDISLDLPQILGRQRLDCNPWKYEAEFYYKTSFGKQSQESFNEICNNKIMATKTLLDIYSNLTDETQKKQLLIKYQDAFYSQLKKEKVAYKTDYVGIKELPTGELVPVMNNLVLLSERRAFELQHQIYNETFYVKAACDSYGFQTSHVLDPNFSYQYAEFSSKQQYEDKMQYCCEVIEKLDPKDANNFLNGLPKKYSEAFRKLSIDFIRKVHYKYYYISEKLKVLNSSIERKKLIQERFQVGERYLVKDIKIILQEIYDSLGFKKKKAKATDLNDYFKAEILQMTDPESKKRVSGYKIISLK